MSEEKLANIDEVATRLLARREHSEKELRRKLAVRRFDESAINEVLLRLQKANAQSDDRFVESYILARASKGYGPFRIRQELKERGISSDLIDQGFSLIDKDWKALAEAVRVKKFGSTMPTDFTMKMKQKQFLHYRGFTSDLC